MISKAQFLYMMAMFVGSSVAGWALLLWEGKQIKRSQVLGGVMLSGFSGVIVSLLLYKHLHDNPTLLAGVSLLAGVGGASSLEFLVVLLRNHVKKRFNKNEQ